MTQWRAGDYVGQSSLQQAMAEEQLRCLILDGGERILDVGCGDGRITAEIAGRVPRGSVVGIDPSRDMIAFASSHFCGPEHANLRFEVGDARRLKFQNEFDLVISFNALHWVPEQTLALDSIHTAVKPRGMAMLRLVPEGRRKCLEDIIEETRQRPNWAGYFTGFHRPYIHFTPDQYRAIAEQCSFSVERLEVEDKAWDFKSRDSFAAFGRATFVEWTRRLPEGQWLDFIADVLDRYESVAADNPSEAHTFKFYQMEAVLTPVPRR
jgi:trans-aconitate 2-methyltransferase